MQDFFTVLVESIAFFFIVIMAIDCIVGLFILFGTIQSNDQSQLQLKILSELQEFPHLDSYNNIKLDAKFESISKLEQQVEEYLEITTESPPKLAPELKLSQLKFYKLRGESVIRLEDIQFEIPVTLKRYKLHKRDVIKLKDLESLLN